MTVWIVMAPKDLNENNFIGAIIIASKENMKKPFCGVNWLTYLLLKL